MVNYERELQIDSTKSRIIEFGLDFAEKSKIEVERNFSDEEITILNKIKQN